VLSDNNRNVCYPLYEYSEDEISEKEDDEDVKMLESNMTTDGTVLWGSTAYPEWIDD
jgi:hypothetical protein